MKEKRRDNKGRILHTGESQRTDGKYLYKYVDAFGNTKYVYAWRLTPTDPTPKGKREKPSLRELEQQIRRDIEDGIDSTGKKMTLCQLYAKQNAQRANVKKSTQKQREQLMRLLKEDKLGARSIDTIKPSDAKEWALRMKDKGFSYNTINNHKRSLKASFYIAIQDDCVRKNPFDFKLSEVLENDTKEKVALTEEQEQALLSFIKTDNVYHKYYDDVLILLKTGLRISELCGLTIMDVDFIHEVVVIDHQLLKSKEQGYYIETPKTKSGTRQVPLSRETIQAFQRVMKKRPKAKPFVIDGRGNFLFVNHKGKPQRQSLATYHTAYTTPYILHKAGKQEHEPERFTVYHGAFKYQYHNELVCSCVHRYRKIRGSASNRIEVFTTILTTIDSENIRR